MRGRNARPTQLAAMAEFARAAQRGDPDPA
jgi:hypothetical protein